MNKAIIAFGSSDFPEGAFRFIQSINEAQPLLVTGAFLPQYDMAHLWMYTDPLTGFSFLPELEEEGISKNKEKFESLCKRYGITYNFHFEEEGLTETSLQSESRFADFLVIDSEKFYDYMGTGSSNPTLKDALHYTECPVVIVPEDYKEPKKIILTYDGSEESMFAIKQFAYLFPKWAEKETLLVYVGAGNSKGLPQHHLVKEWVDQHFTRTTMIRVEAASRGEFTAWVAQNTDSLLVGGSFSRSVLSEFFKKSFLADIISELKLPVFIAHR